jgi:hypothetical protein
MLETESASFTTSELMAAIYWEDEKELWNNHESTHKMSPMKEDTESKDISFV